MKPFPTQLNLFFNAMAFFTRIPVPSRVDFSPENLNRASRYFPLVGLLVGAIAAIIWWTFSLLLPLPLAVLLSMAATLLLTGAFHEDGLADCADGFGGGWQRSRVLEIMKDSRIGTFGTAALIMVLAIKFTALSSITELVVALLLGHSLSRLAAVWIIFRDDYAREDELSKSKPLASHIDKQSLIIASLPVLLILLLQWDIHAWLVLLPVAAITLACSAYFRKRLGGYTGDCLGACQQLTEVGIYLWFCLPFIR